MTYSLHVLILFIFWIFSIFKITGKVRGPEQKFVPFIVSSQQRPLWPLSQQSTFCSSQEFFRSHLRDFPSFLLTKVFQFCVNLQVDHCLFRGMFRIQNFFLSLFTKIPKVCQSFLQVFCSQMEVLAFLTIICAVPLLPLLLLTTNSQ